MRLRAKPGRRARAGQELELRGGAEEHALAARVAGLSPLPHREADVEAACDVRHRVEGEGAELGPRPGDRSRAAARRRQTRCRAPRPRRPGRRGCRSRRSANGCSCAAAGAAARRPTIPDGCVAFQVVTLRRPVDRVVAAPRLAPREAELGQGALDGAHAHGVSLTGQLLGDLGRRLLGLPQARRDDEADHLERAAPRRRGAGWPREEPLEPLLAVAPKLLVVRAPRTAELPQNLSEVLPLVSPSTSMTRSSAASSSGPNRQDAAWPLDLVYR